MSRKTTMQGNSGKEQQPSDLPSPALVRRQNVELLKRKGFLVSSSLPVRNESDAALLRPVTELAGRLAALNAIFLYAAPSSSSVPTSQVLDHIRAADLRRHMSPEEAAILALDRTTAAEEYGNEIGWRTENAIALAWVLGREGELAFDGTMLVGAQIRPLVTEWPPLDGAGFNAWAATLRPRAPAEVAAMEDLFWCAHNAVRSAQIQLRQSRDKTVRPDTVPSGFNPFVNGGVIHERRHALTWALSPGIGWEDTDLST